MTLEELSQHFKLREKLERDRELLASLMAATGPQGQAFTGMPRTPGFQDRVGTLAVEITQVRDRIHSLEKEISRQEEAVEVFISQVPDEFLMTLFRLRFVRGLNWCEVATVVGGRNTEQSVKAACYRYLRSHKS